MADVEEEDKGAQLQQYKEQLVAVENALSEMEMAEEKDEDGITSLKDAKNDLLEVISLLEGIVEAPAAQAPAPTAPPGGSTLGGSTNTIPVHQHQYVGRTCEAFLGQQWYNAQIFSVTKDASGSEKATLVVFGQKERKECSLKHIRMLKPPHPAQCRIGAKCQAIFTQDGLWYDAVIENSTETGYIVKFNDYASSEEVKFDQIRFKTEDPKKATSSQAKRPIEEITTAAGYKYPKNLMIKPDDTDQVRANKKRKMDMLKKEQKKEREEQMSTNEANSWKKFLIKGGNAKKGFRKAGNAKESLFSGINAFGVTKEAERALMSNDNSRQQLFKK